MPGPFFVAAAILAGRHGGGRRQGPGCPGGLVGAAAHLLPVYLHGDFGGSANTGDFVVARLTLGYDSPGLGLAGEPGALRLPGAGASRHPHHQE